MAQITVITSAYNVGAYIERYVSSLKSQTFKDFVVICRDDHSSDDTLEKLRELCKDDDRFQIIESAQNEGVYYNLKQTLDSVETPYLCFLDPDDWIDDAYWKVYTMPSFKAMPIWQKRVLLAIMTRGESSMIIRMRRFAKIYQSDAM